MGRRSGEEARKVGSSDLQMPSDLAEIPTRLLDPGPWDWGANHLGVTSLHRVLRLMRLHKITNTARGHTGGGRL